MLFKFTLNTTYQRGVIEYNNEVEVKFEVKIQLNAHEHLHSSHVNVEVEVEPNLRRPCRSPKVWKTVIDSAVIVLAMLASIGYSLSIVRSIRLTKVSIHNFEYPSWLYNVSLQ